ncbi:helix-turn-helix domain-containing protein [Microvirgula aerodenitrificans]|uniref:helix-turn-helix domain-containing protein n=1 Tax=Microvirgula aerodenitrificans TaxID=57480 RepID=UPI0006862051|nr:helix-turn-helix domain-containing protein [Microvirgula aerodenitrificans]
METTPDYQNDPPLRALRTFEAFARLDTVTAAARELGITASAVSHQLRLLEEFLQTPLTERQGRKLVLTEAGGEYYRAIRSAFTLLRGATGQVLDSASTRQITLSVIPLFGLGWLVPRLPSFLAAHPGLDLNILYAHHRNYLSDAADLSVRFGSGQWRGYRSTRLLPGAAVPVCSREFLDRHGPLSGPGALAGLPQEVLARIRIHLQLATGTAPQAVIEEPDITSHDLVIVRAAMKYMAENIARPISLEDISRHIGTYEKKLSNAFRTHTGKSVFEYLREERLCRARQLLSTTPLSIHEIALEVGFSSAANFATSFRDRFDTTPSEFRKNPDG